MTRLCLDCGLPIDSTDATKDFCSDACARAFQERIDAYADEDEDTDQTSPEQDG